MSEDAYKVLGLCPGATDEAIRSAYRSRARQLHPDASGDPDTAEAFRQATAAYEELRARSHGEGTSVPVRHGPGPRRGAPPAEPLRAPRPARPSRAPAEDLAARGRRRTAPRPVAAGRRPAEPLVRPDPVAEPMRARRSRWRGAEADDLESLLRLLGADFFDD